MEIGRTGSLLPTWNESAYVLRDFTSKIYFRFIAYSAYNYYLETLFSFLYSISSITDIFTTDGPKKGNISAYQSFGVGLTEVEIDCLTGEHKVHIIETEFDIYILCFIV
jgi:xanthine dehydrogenase molybdopterin-binding subunit B